LAGAAQHFSAVMAQAFALSTSSQPAEITTQLAATNTNIVASDA
jgi:HPt (histidine-containing phosphotransfer) domain-containing protein